MGDKGDAYKTINITDAKNIINAGNAVLLDIRDRDSYLQEHIPNAIHLTQDNIEDFKKNTELDEVIIIYCYHGNNSLGAAEYFSNMGYQNIYSLNGGFSEFKKQN